MIYIDVSAAIHGRAGLGRYSEELAQALIMAQPDRYALFFNRSGDGRLPDSLRQLVQARQVPVLRCVQLGYKPWRMAVLLGHRLHLSFDRLVPGARLFHSTEHLLMPLGDVPTVLTVHDLIYKLFPAYHKKLNYWYLNLAMPLYCRRATAIVAVSQATRRDIVKYYGIDPAKIFVVYEAASSLFQPQPSARVASVRQKYQLPERFLMHLGTIEPRKNLSRLLDALKALRQLFPDLSLVLAGGRGWLYDDFFAKIETEGLAGAVQVLGWVPDEDLAAVIAVADLAVQPSLYEGFGLPVLEHMACGQVVAASRISSHAEIGGDAAVYFDPYSVEEMAAVIHRLLSNREEYQHRVQLSLEQAQKFSWQRTAQETIAVYDHLF